MNQILMALMAFGAVCGGVDRILNNRFGLGERFEEGFNLLGPLALSMPGIMCLIPAISGFIETVIAPACRFLHLDPGTFGGVLAIDMGGYQLAMNLAVNPAIGRFAGILIAATFGCTVVFTIPVGMGLIPPEARNSFARGLLLGFSTLPLTLLTGGIAAGLTMGELLTASIPVVCLSILLCIGMIRFQDTMIRGFSKAAKGIQVLSTVGLILVVVRYLTGFELLPGMIPLEEAMQVVCSIGIVMLGTLPLAELIKRLMDRPIRWFARRTGMNSDGTTGLMIGAISVTPALGMFGHMDDRSRVVNGAALVSGASALAAHFGFTLAMEPELVPALLIGKFSGMLGSIILALLVTGRRQASNHTIQ
ncbi:MAG: ethanolamine utilization protein EutH [Clostridia bacterium]|nr:ethanolamine utilization protein EutH [Clostridia bacterium]